MDRPGPDVVGFALGASNRRLLAGALALLCGALFLWAATSEAWAGEDAFITFRTVDNFVNGYGLRWNVDERVQSYTHPLWLFANIPLYYLLRDVPTTTTVMGLLCSGGAFAILSLRFLRWPLALVFGVFLPLTSSSAFVLYSTSGFENPLSHLCFAVFAVLFLRALDAQDAEAVPWGGLALAASLAAVNRLDMAIVYAPPLLFLLDGHWRRLPWGRFLLGFSPLAAWLLFSTFYYGFPYPNTALSKMNGEIAAGTLFRQGVFYALDLLVRDPVGFGMILLGAALSAWSFARPTSRGRGARSLGIASLGAGALLYVVYVLSIGVAFLACRHWTVPILNASVQRADALATFSEKARRWRAAGILASELRRSASRPGVRAADGVGLVVALCLAFGGPRVADFTKGRARRINERSRAHFFLGDDFEWQGTGYAAGWAARGRGLPAGRVTVRGAIGITGYFAPREATIVDFFGLADPLVARLPTRPRFRMVGHFRRAVPKGYPEVRNGGSLELLDPALRDYYEPLKSIVSDPLFSPQRLRNLVAFNLGRYDDRLEAYVRRAAPPPPDDSEEDEEETPSAPESG